MFGVAFLSPLFLIGLVAAAIPIAIHMFHRRERLVIEFAAMRYLPNTPVADARRRLREWLLLALRVAALALLAIGFARPYLSESVAAPGASATVVMIDTSASLSAPGQIQQARMRAEQVIRAAPAGDAVGVATVSSTVDWIAPLSQDRAAALAALEDVRAGAGATRYRAGLGDVVRAFGGRGGRIVVVTDLQPSGWGGRDEGTVPDRIRVEVAEVDGPPANLAVTDLHVEGREAVASVQGFSSDVMTAQVSFAVDGQAAGAVAIRVDGRAQATARMPLPDATSGTLSASVIDPEGYAADNTRYAVLGSSNAARVLAVTASGHPSESFYLERAVGVARGIDGFGFRAVGGAEFSRMTPKELATVEVVLILGTRGIEPNGRELLTEHLRAGGGILLAASPDVDPMHVGRLLRDVVQSSWRPRENRALRFAPHDARHPVFRPFDGEGSLSTATFSNAALVEVPQSAAVLARYSDGTPALVEERSGNGRVLVFASDLNNRWNDFPLQPTFVPFVHEVLRHLGGARDTRVDYLVGELPGEAGRMPGVTTVGAGTRGFRQVAVNVDVREADPGRMTVDEFTAGIPRQPAGDAPQAAVVAEVGDREDSQRWWQYALLLMAFSLVAEGVLGRRLV